MMFVVVVLLFFKVAVGNLLHEFGVDVASGIDQSQAQCLHDKFDATYAIVRAYRSTDEPDPRCPSTLDAFNAASGFTSLSVYIFPCAVAGCLRSPAEQVERALAPLQGYSLDHVWLDIEGPNQYWTGDARRNTQFIAAMVQAVRKQNRRPGIYASDYDWAQITGSPPQGNSSFSSLPLWYAYYDNQTNYDDFQSFGGWSSPYMKQFAGNVRGCDTSFDWNWHSFHFKRR